MKKSYSSMEKMKKLWFLFIVVAIGNVCASAIAQTTSTTIPLSCDITLDPEFVTIFTFAGTEGFPFSSTVEGNCNDPCYTWDIIQDGSVGSTVNNHGKYYPGNSEGTDIVRITDPCNENISDIAVVNYISYPSYEEPKCHLIIYPGNEVIHIGETLQLSVFPSGCSNYCPSWEITEAGSNGSSIDVNGLYTAGSTPGTDVITVTDPCNESIPASVTISVGLVPTSTNKFNRMWPTLSQPWYFNEPTRIIVDDSGYVYVRQNNPPSISKFTSDGQFVTRWGKYGSGKGELNSSGCMAVDKKGFVYVADFLFNRDRIQKFTSDGQFVSEWGTFGSGDEEIENPYTMIIDEKGFFYIASFHVIKKFTSDGHFVTKWGSKCDRYDGSGCEDPDGDGPLDLGDGQFDQITSIALDRYGFVYVLDGSYGSRTPRIQKFTSEGEFVNKWEIDTSDITHFEGVCAIAIDGNGFMYVSFDANVSSGGILKFSPDGQFVDEWGGYGSGDEELIGPWDIAVDMNGFVYVSEFYVARIQKLTSDGHPVETWKSWGTGDGEFFRPFDIEIDMDGFVYVHELYSSRIQKFTPEGQFVETLPSHGQLKEIDSNNFFYYIDDHSNVDEGLIKKVSSDGEIVAQWDRTGSGDTVLLGPCDVAVDMNGFVYVADQGYYDSFWYVEAFPTHHILKFSPDGKFVERWGKHGDGEDELSSVAAIAVDMNGFVYVCTGDTPWDGQIKKFTAEGQFVASWNAYCWDITVDTNGFVYCADTEPYLQYTGPNQRMLKFSSDGQFVDTWGSIGSNPGQVLGIGSIEVSPNNEIYITDVMNHRIQVFEETSIIETPNIQLLPNPYPQSRWMPVMLLLRIQGTNTHFDRSSRVTFDPSGAVIALPILGDGKNILMIGLLMPAWLMSTQSIDVTVTTGTEVVSEELNLDFSFTMTNK